MIVCLWKETSKSNKWMVYQREGRAGPICLINSEQMIYGISFREDYG